MNRDIHILKGLNRELDTTLAAIQASIDNKDFKPTDFRHSFYLDNLFFSLFWAGREPPDNYWPNNKNELATIKYWSTKVQTVLGEAKVLADRANYEELYFNLIDFDLIFDSAVSEFIMLAYDNKKLFSELIGMPVNDFHTDASRGGGDTYILAVNEALRLYVYNVRLNGNRRVSDSEGSVLWGTW